MSRPFLLIILLSVFTLQVSSLCFATIRYVDAIGGPNHYTTISEAYNAATNGDTILISAGDYADVITSTKRLTYIGAGFSSPVTRVTGSITLNAGSSGTIIEGIFFERAGTMIALAGAVDSIFIRRNGFRGTGNAHISRASATSGGRLYIGDCIFVRNQSNPCIQLSGDSLTLSNSVFGGNPSDWISPIAGTPSSMAISNCVFTAINLLFNCPGSYPLLVTNCIFYDFYTTGGFGTHSGQANWAYNASSGALPPGTDAVLLTQNPFVNYNVSQNYQWGITDLHLNNVAGGGADCIDAGDPNVLDLDGSRSDLGIYGGQTPYLDSGAPNYPFVQSLTVPPSVTVGNQLQIQSQGRIGRGY